MFFEQGKKLRESECHQKILFPSINGHKQDTTDITVPTLSDVKKSWCHVE